jgi:hypothetical protein
MNTWTPLWNKVVDSSLWSEPDLVVKVFLTMLAKKDADHIVRANAYQIARWSNKTEDEAIEALRVLSSPDTRRKEAQPFDGRRIERVPDGWVILNGKYYRDMIQTIRRREYKRDWQANKRMKAKAGAGSKAEQQFVKEYGNGKEL